GVPCQVPTGPSFHPGGVESSLRGSRERGPPIIINGTFQLPGRHQNSGDRDEIETGPLTVDSLTVGGWRPNSIRCVSWFQVHFASRHSGAWQSRFTAEWFATSTRMPVFMLPGSFRVSGPF